MTDFLFSSLKVNIMIKKTQLRTAYENMLSCGLDEQAAQREIGHALHLINKTKGDTKNGDMTKANIDLINSEISMVAYYGLSLDDTKNEATLVAQKRGRGKGCFFMPLYGGLLKIMVEEKAIIGAECQVAHQGDVLEIDAGKRTGKVKHIMKAFGKEPVIVTWCILYLPSGIEQLTLFKEYEYQMVKKMGTKMIHDFWGDQMRMKSCLKRARKFVSGAKTVKLDKLITVDNSHYDFDTEFDSPEDEIKNTPETKNGSEHKKNDPNPHKLPVLNQNHQWWSGSVKALAEKTHTIDTLSDHMYISDDVRALLELEAKNFIPEPQKKSV